MPAINEWIGNAPATPTRLRVMVDIAVEGLLYEIRGPYQSAVYRAAAGDSRGAIAAALHSQVRNWGDWTTSPTQLQPGIQFTGRQPGVPLWRSLTVHSPKSSFTEIVTEGQRASPQQILITLPATTTGGTWSVTLDWGSGPETASGLAHDITPAALAAAVDALATPTALGGGATAELVSTSPRQYRLRLAGDLAIGVNATASASGSGLTGNATVHVTRAQSTGGNAPAVYWLTCRYYVSETSNQSGLRITLGETNHDVHVIIDQNVQQAAWWNARLPSTVSGFVIADYEDVGDPGLRAFALAFSVPSNVSVTCSPLAFDGNDAVQAASITRLQDYQGSSNDEFQFVRPGSGIRTLTFDGEETASHASNQNLKTLLEALTNIDVDDVAVSTGHVLQHFPGQWDAPALVHFRNGLGAADQPQLVPSGIVDVTIVNNGSGPVNNIHRVAITAEGGTFTALVPLEGVDPTAAIDYLETAANVATAIEATLSEGETVSVSGAGPLANPYLIEYTGDLAQTTIPLIVIDGANLTGGQPVATETAVAAQPGANQIERLRIDPFASGGTLRIQWGGLFTTDVAYDADASDWETALEGIAGAGNVLVDGGSGVFNIEYVSDLSWQPLPGLRVDQDNLIVSDASALTLRLDDRGSGPADYSAADNWTLGHVPNSGEQVVFGSGRQSCLYGLLQRAEFTVENAPTSTLHCMDNDLQDNQIVRLRTSGTFPEAEDADEQAVVLDDGTDYYIVSISQDGRRIVLSETSDGPPLTFTTAGTGTHVIEVQLASLTQRGRYSGHIGLPRRDSQGVYEFLPRYLAVGLLPPQGPDDNLVIGQGPGNQSNRLLLDLRGSPVRALVMETGSGQELPALLLLLDHADAEVHVVNGEIGIAVEPAESSRLGRINSYGGRTLLGNVLVSHLGNFNAGIEYIRGSASADQVQTSH